MARFADQHSSQVFGLELRPARCLVPRPDSPLQPKPGSGHLQPDRRSPSSFTLLLSREDGDQYLGHLNFTMPPGLTANLQGVTYCPEADIAAAASTAGRTEQADPSCPASSEIGTVKRRRWPGSHPFHAVGKIYYGRSL